MKKQFVGKLIGSVVVYVAGYRIMTSVWESLIGRLMCSVIPTDMWKYISITVVLLAIPFIVGAICALVSRMKNYSDLWVIALATSSGLGYHTLVSVVQGFGVSLNRYDFVEIAMSLAGALFCIRYLRST